ncbi:MAG: HAD-IC family P-type ATPase, partial [Clostridia bacterium]|nr:HAD-IC family P-type ATPase [Clostridia bacterium]
MNRKQKTALARILLTAVLLVSTALFSPGDGMRFFLYIMMYLIIGGPVLMKAGRSILRGRVFTEAFLMSVATLGAFLLAILTKSGDYFEAIAVMLYYQVGELFESWAVNKSRNNIASLMDIRPDSAHLETEAGLCTLHPEKIPVGSIIQVQPGEKIPLDGVVLEGTSSLNTAALTGESLPMDVQPGSTVQSGEINLSGLLRIRTTQPFETSTASRVLALVENASSRKARSEHFIARFARVYTPLVCWLALALAVLPPLLMLLIQGHADFLPWFYRGLTFLVVSCPCALVISVPLTFFAGIGGASRCGVLVKGANYLEAMSKAKTVAFDKTGTLTQGVFKVQAVHPVEMSEEELLKCAAHAECASSHPIARSLQTAYGKEICRENVQDIREESGYGVFATVYGKKVAVGNGRLMEKMAL